MLIATELRLLLTNVITLVNKQINLLINRCWLDIKSERKEMLFKWHVIFISRYLNW